MALLVTSDDRDSDATWEVVPAARRLAGGMIDFFLIVMLASGLLTAGAANGWLPPVPAEPAVPTMAGLLPSQLLVLAVQVLYYFGWEALTYRTPGKLICQTRVMGVDGADPTVLRILLRTLVRLVPFEPVSFLGPLPGGWHDRWTSTCVVRRTDLLGEAAEPDDDAD